MLAPKCLAAHRRGVYRRFDRRRGCRRLRHRTECPLDVGLHLQQLLSPVTPAVRARSREVEDAVGTAGGDVVVAEADVGPQGDEETLYQTWEQYARTALGYALDRIASLEQQRTSDLATIADLRTQIQSALARITSIEQNEVDDDAVDTVLLTTVADLLTRVEALENP